MHFDVGHHITSRLVPRSVQPEKRMDLATTEAAKAGSVKDGCSSPPVPTRSSSPPSGKENSGSARHMLDVDGLPKLGPVKTLTYDELYVSAKPSSCQVPPALASCSRASLAFQNACEDKMLISAIAANGVPGNAPQARASPAPPANGKPTSSQETHEKEAPASDTKSAAPAVNDSRNIVRRKLTGYVGFANLPNQWHRKSVRKGFNFNVMVVGKHRSIVLRRGASC